MHFKTQSTIYSLHFKPSLQSTVCILYQVYNLQSEFCTYILSPGCNLQFAICSVHIILTDIYDCFGGDLCDDRRTQLHSFILIQVQFYLFYERYHFKSEHATAKATAGIIGRNMLKPGARFSEVPKTVRAQKPFVNLATAFSGKPIF